MARENITEMVSREDLASANTLGGLQIIYLGNNRAGSWRALDSDHGSELRIWRQRAGFPLDVLGDLAVEASPRAGAGSARRFLRDANDCDPLRAVRSRDQGYSGAKRIVLVFLSQLFRH